MQCSRHHISATGVIRIAHVIAIVSTIHCAVGVVYMYGVCGIHVMHMFCVLCTHGTLRVLETTGKCVQGYRWHSSHLSPASSSSITAAYAPFFKRSSISFLFICGTFE